MYFVNLPLQKSFQLNREPSAFAAAKLLSDIVGMTRSGQLVIDKCSHFITDVRYRFHVMHIMRALAGRG